MYLQQATQAADRKPYLVTVPGTDVQVDINPASSEILNIVGLIAIPLIILAIMNEVDK